jgi:hypothetical protein
MFMLFFYFRLIEFVVLFLSGCPFWRFKDLYLTASFNNIVSNRSYDLIFFINVGLHLLADSLLQLYVSFYFLLNAELLGRCWVLKRILMMVLMRLLL